MGSDALLSKKALAREALISGAINAAFSAAFMMLVFGGASLVPLRGAGGLVGDSLPQSFAIALMASLVPTLLLRKTSGHAFATAKTIVLRSLLTAIGVAALAITVHWLFLPAGSAAFRTALIAKTLYGGSLGAAVTTITLIRWSKDRIQTVSSG